LSCKFR